MAVNQFTRGIQPQQYKPTYIQKPVNMYQQVAGGLSNRYKKAQQTEDRRQMMIQKLGQSPFEKDQKLAEEIGKHYSQRRDEREKAGDYENMFRETRRDAQEAIRKVDPIRQHRKQYQQWSKAIDERDDISEKKKREWKQMVVDNYNRTQGGLDYNEDLEVTGGYFSGSQPSADVNIPKKAEELAEGWKADGRETVQILDSNGTYQTVDIEEASDEQIKAYATQALRADPEVQAYLEDESELRTYHSGSDLSRYLQPQEVPKRDKKGNILKDDEGRPLMKEVSTSEALIGETAPERVEKYVDQGLSEENARKETYKDLYKQEQMAKGAGFAAEKYGYLDIDRDLGSLSGYGDGNGGSGDDSIGDLSYTNRPSHNMNVKPFVNPDDLVSKPKYRPQIQSAEINDKGEGVVKTKNGDTVKVSPDFIERLRDSGVMDKESLSPEEYNRITRRLEMRGEKDESASESTGPMILNASAVPSTEVAESLFKRDDSPMSIDNMKESQKRSYRNVAEMFYDPENSDQSFEDFIRSPETKQRVSGYLEQIQQQEINPKIAIGQYRREGEKGRSNAEDVETDIRRYISSKKFYDPETGEVLNGREFYNKVLSGGSRNSGYYESHSKDKKEEKLGKIKALGNYNIKNFFGVADEQFSDPYAIEVNGKDYAVTKPQSYYDSEEGKRAKGINRIYRAKAIPGSVINTKIPVDHNDNRDVEVTLEEDGMYRLKTKDGKHKVEASDAYEAYEELLRSVNELE